MLGNEGQVLARSERFETKNVDLVGRLELVVVGGIGEGQGKHALLLQVGLVDTGERPDNDGETTEVTWLESCVLTGRTLAVVGVTNDDPLDTLLPVFSGNFGNTSPFTGELVLDVVGFAVSRVDGTDEAVL